MTSPANSSSTSNSASTPSPTGASTSARSSYATATKGKPASPTVVPSNAPPTQGGAATHNAMSNSVSPVNGKPPGPSNPRPNMSGPAIVSSSNTNGSSEASHSRKPSAVTISASGTSYNNANGSTAGPAAPRPNINFGSMNAGGSPAITNSVPHVPQNSLSTPANAGPARSPSPINPPTASGGRPPSGLQGPGAQLNFGTLPGGDAAEGVSLSMPVDSACLVARFPGDFYAHAYHPYQSRLPLPQGPAAQLQGPHLRRDSSQSSHSDMNNSVNRGFMPNGRGQPPFRPGQPYPATGMPHSPQPGFRPNVMQQRGGQPPNMPMYQQPSRMPNSPYAGRGAPAMPGNNMQQQAHYPGMPVVPPYGYPGHPAQQFSPQGAQGMYGQPHAMPQEYAAGYPYGQPYPGQFYAGVPPYGAAPPSPRGYPQAQGYNAQGYNPQGMSRQSSQTPDRPGSTQPTTPGVPSSQQPPTPGTGTGASSPGPAQQFQPPRKSKAIQIKRPDGTEVSLDKLASPPGVPAANRGPVVISSAAGTPSSSTPPPPRTASFSAPSHHRTDSQTAKTAEEKTAEFREQFKRQLAAEGGEDQSKQEDDDKSTEDDAENEKAEAEKAAREKEAKEKEESDRKAKEAEAAATQASEEADKAATEAKSSADAEAEKKRLADEEMDRWIAEMEAKEAEEAEADKKYAEDRKRREEEAKKQGAAAPEGETDAELKRQEREAEELELAKEKKASAKETDDESAKLFASLKKPTLGPGAAEDSGASTPAPESPVPQPAQLAVTAAVQPKPAAVVTSRPKPAALKLETNKPVEPAQPTAGMNSLKSARFLDILNMDKIYPNGVQSPNPALNATAKGRGRQYDKEFLLQFQVVFKEKPSLEWDRILKDTVGDTSDSARPQSGTRTPSVGGRQNSRPAMGGGMISGGAMGNFGAAGAGGRTLPPGTTSAQRFANPSDSRGPGMQSNSFGRSGQGFAMGATPMGRTGSQTGMGGQTVGSPRTASSRGGNRSRHGGPSVGEQAKMAKTMPLTAGQDLKPLEVSKSGWKPTNLGSTGPALPSGHMAPDMVQRKVKASLNKMTPEKFAKISDDILNIAAQSKDEQDGRSLRQVIQLTFEKACDEAHWASMYARFCKRMLETMSHDIKDEGVRDKNGQPVVGGALFRKYLLNRCQEEFERGWENNLPAKPEGQAEEVMLSDDYYISAAAKRRGLGLIQFIGELYKLDMLNIRIMHECVFRLLNFEGLPDESSIESLVKLIRTVGGKMEASPNGHALIDPYFDRIKSVIELKGLPSRLYYMLLVSSVTWNDADTYKLTSNHRTLSISDDQAGSPRTMPRARRRSRKSATTQRPRGRLPTLNECARMPAAVIDPKWVVATPGRFRAVV